MARGEPVHYAWIDKTGAVRIRLEPRQYARSFSEGLAAVSTGGLWGYIDASGRYVIPPRFGSAEEFSDGLAKVTEAPPDQYWSPETLFGYIGRDGNFAIQPRFNWAGPFSEGLAPVCEGPCRNQDLPLARMGYIDQTGKYVLPPTWRDSAPIFQQKQKWVMMFLAN